MLLGAGQTKQHRSRCCDQETKGVEASNVINDPKCNKGPNCNNVWP